MDGEILVIDADTLEMSFYWDAESTEPNYTITLAELAKEWFGMSEALGAINVHGADLLFEWDAETDALSVRYEDPANYSGMYFMLDTSTGMQTGYLSSNDFEEITATLITGENLFKLGDAINREMEKLERGATLCQDTVDANGNPICMFADGSFGTLDLTDFSLSMSDANGFVYYKMSIDDTFWWMEKEYGRYEIQTLDESGDVLTFSWDETAQ